jgi:peptide/nickel transport system substrate-binding protein
MTNSRNVYDSIGRRQLLKRAGAATILSLAPGLLPTVAQVQTPKRGGFLKAAMGEGSTTDTLDPSIVTGNYMNALQYSLRNQLTEIDGNGHLAPELAESWEPSPKADRWVFNLRKGVEFHNGKSLDANDVVASINYHRGKSSKSGVKAVVDPITDIKADGKDRVVFTLAAGNADLPYLLTEVHLLILPAKNGDIDWQTGIGTGGYVLKSFSPGVRADLIRNPNYWKADKAHFDHVQLLTIADTVARTNALTSGAVHLINRPDLRAIELLKRVPGVRVEEVKGAGFYSASMRTDMGPFNNNHIRLAIKYSLDRKAALQTVLQGHGYEGNDTPIGPTYRYFAADVPQRTYDPEKAKYHLKQAGLSKLNVSLSAADAAFAGAVDAAQIFKQKAAAAGIDIDVVREPNDGYWENVWMKKPWCMSYWSGRPTEDMILTMALAKGGPWSETFWDNPRFNELLIHARGELDDKKRKTMYGEMQHIVADDGGLVVPMFNNYVFAMSNKLAHGPISSAYDLDGTKFAERWWFA